MRAANSGFVINKEMFADPNSVNCEVFAKQEGESLQYVDKLKHLLSVPSD